MSTGNRIDYDSRFKILNTIPGYAHNTYEGTFTGNPTVEELEKAFFDPYFGGRGATLDKEKGTFRVIEHID